MSQKSKDILSKAIFGTLAVALSFGAAQLAFGRDLAETAISAAPSGTPDAAINRATKADRVAGLVASAAPTRTVSLRFDGLSDTSVLIRVPLVTDATPNARGGSSVTKPGDQRIAVACEPVVSVLTEVARHLQPGRCVT
jgi:hypothetical protein